MPIQTLDITRVDLNPWNRPIDADYVARDLAPDILIHTLLQPFVVRTHPTAPGRFQAAIGNHRTSALQLLVQQGHPAFRHVALDVRDLTDVQMMDYAIAENDQRRPLTDIERAEYIVRLTQPPFRLPQGQAGAKLGLSESAASNLLRLLKLPKEIKALSQSGDLPQRHARQLVTLSQTLPLAALVVAKRIAAAGADNSTETKDAAFEQGLTAALDQHGRRIKDFGEHFKLTAKLPVTYVAAAARKLGITTDDALPACKGCEFFLQRERWSSYCVRPACHDAKSLAHRWANVTAAATARGLAPAAPAELKKITVLFDGESATHAALARAALKAKDPSLRLVALPGEISEWHADATARHALLGTNVAVLGTTDLADLKHAYPQTALAAAQAAIGNHRTLSQAEREKARKAIEAEQTAIEAMLATAALALAPLLPAVPAVLELLVDRYDKALTPRDQRVAVAKRLLQRYRYQRSAAANPAAVAEALRALAAAAGFKLPRDFGGQGQAAKPPGKPGQGK